jgi:hypothetical protein
LHPLDRKSRKQSLHDKRLLLREGHSSNRVTV